MSDFQSKFQKGLSSVQKGFQKGFEQGKSKIQISQEILSLKMEVEENKKKRLEMVNSIGELAHKKVQNKEIADESLISLSNSIAEIDKDIDETLKLIEEKKKSEEEAKEMTCECGAKLSPEDNFCKSCGKKVD